MGAQQGSRLEHGVDDHGTTAWSKDSHLDGEVARTFRFRALTGESVTLASADDLKLVTWTTSVRFTIDGQEFGFQSGPAGTGDGIASSLPEFAWRGSLSIGDGEARLGEARNDLSHLSANDRRQFLDASPTASTDSSWIASWTDGRFDLVAFGYEWLRAEEEFLHQIAPFLIHSSPEGISISVRPGSSRITLFGSQVSAHVPPIGSVTAYSRNESRALIPAIAGLDLNNGQVYRIELDSSDDLSEQIVFSSSSATGIISDPRFDRLDQHDRMGAISSMSLEWSA